MDPASRSMATSGRGSGVVGYNVQVAVDTEHHLIVTREVTNTELGSITNSPRSPHRRRSFSDGCVAQRQRSRREDRGRRACIALTGKAVENDIVRMNHRGRSLGISRLDRRQPVGKHRGEDIDHLPIAVVDAGKLASDAFHGGR